MTSEHAVPRGRGSGANPPNRFERLHYEPDPDADPAEAPSPATQFFRDNARSLIVTNDSPDVGFDASINPYRGCEHGCVYCMSGDTPILMGNGTTRRLADVRAGDVVYGTGRRGWYRRYARTRVLAHWCVERPAYRVTLRDGTVLIAGADHRFLTERGWKFVTGSDRGTGQRPYLTPNNKLMGTGAFASPPDRDAEDYRTGYLCGMIRGDGLLREYHYPDRVSVGGKRQCQFRPALTDREALMRSAAYLRHFGVPTYRALFQEATEATRRLDAIRTSARALVNRVRELIAWPAVPSRDWCLGFLAGIFDAEGYHGEGCLRIPNTDPGVITHTTLALARLGFRHVPERITKERGKPLTVVRVCGGLRENLRFLHATDPAILRKRDIAGLALKNSADLRVAAVEPLGVSLPLFDITTGTGDFIANGVVSHNCYARPTHEYLGLSAGLDFETKIFVKEDAPALLRRELSARAWRPRPLGVCGVTDAYQPVERRLRLTRRCLEVLADFRNPAVVITKSHLVTRDLDVLGELARHGAAAVFVSLTTLDGALVRVMEPRATQPAGRLAAVRAAAGAGVPVGVLVAPVIPGLNDHEIPAILGEAAAAGARYAGYVVLRLPHGLGDLFTHWLEQHLPERKDRVLGRLRELRGGKLNDPRFGSRMRGEGVLAKAIRDLFALARRKAGMLGRGPQLSAAAFRRPAETAPSLFDLLDD